MLRALARHYGQNESYVSRIIRLTSLSPKLQEKIMACQVIGGRTLADIMAGVPEIWKVQEGLFDS